MAEWMSDHLALCVDRLVTPESLQSLQNAEPEIPCEDGASQTIKTPSCVVDVHGVKDDGDSDDSSESQEDEPFLQIGECRICQEEDSIQSLETPCACNGSLKYAHRRCVQQWCNEKGDINCEICHQPYQSGYTAPPRALNSDDTTIDISEIWTISGAPLDPRNLAIVAAERQLLEAEYDYADHNANGAAFLRSAALILMALLLLRHALSLNGGDGEDEDDVSALFSLFLLRVVGFLLPCYIMAWAISILQRRRQRQEAAEVAANEVAFMIRAAHQNGLRFTIAAPAASALAAPTIEEPHHPPLPRV